MHMADVTNPGVVNVADETYGNPDPNGGQVLLVPEELDALTAAAAQGYPPAIGVTSAIFPTASMVVISDPPPFAMLPQNLVPPADNIIVDDQVIGQGIWVYVDPIDPSAGKRFVPPNEFLVVGPQDTIQLNYSEETTVLCTISAVYDADKLWTLASASPNATRFLIVVAPPALTSYPISILGREIVFTDNPSPVINQGATRVITGYNTNYLVIGRNDPSDESVPVMDAPVVGNTFYLDTQRQGAQVIDRITGDVLNVVILPPPPTFVFDPNQALNNQGNVDVSTGPQPGQPVITSGVQVPTAMNVFVAEQEAVIGLPVNVFV
jgi:hypothetical protein